MSAPPHGPPPWLADILASPPIQQLGQRYARTASKPGGRPRGGVVTQARGSAALLTAAALAAATDRPVLHVVAHLDEAD